MAHRRAKLTPFGRLPLVQRVEEMGQTVARMDLLIVVISHAYLWASFSPSQGLTRPVRLLGEKPPLC